MKLLLKLGRWMLFCLVLVMISCNDGDDNGDAFKYRRTLIVYMAAQNSLGSEGCSKLDSLEIIAGAVESQSKNDNIILFIDDDRNPRIHSIYRESDGVCYTHPVYQYPYDANSADGKTLLDVLVRVKSQYPSKSYGLVMWDHGSGWLPEITSNANSMRAICIDVGPGGNMASDTKSDGSIGDQMSIESMADAIQQSGIHFDYIFFDACYMQSLEIAWALRNVTDYMVSNPTVVSSYGAYYTNQIKSGFFVYPTNDAHIRAIVDTYYYDGTKNPITKKDYEAEGFVISVIKMSELNNLAKATSVCLKTALKDSRARKLSNIMEGYATYEYTGYPDCFDPGVAFSRLVPQEEYDNWRSALERCVIHWKATETYCIAESSTDTVRGRTDFEHGSGVSMFFPQDKYNPQKVYFDYNEVIKKTDWYKCVWPKEEE